VEVVPASEITKRILADGLKKLMQDKALASISISDITSQCGISRNTFYYHFQDKYDLVNWIFYTEVTPQVSNFTDLEHWPDGLAALYDYMLQNRLFYINALSNEGQNSLSDCLMNYYEMLIINVVTNSNYRLNLSNDEIQVVSKFYSNAIIGSILDWAKNGMQYNPKDYIPLFQSIINGKLIEKAISR